MVSDNIRLDTVAEDNVKFLFSSANFIGKPCSILKIVGNSHITEVDSNGRHMVILHEVKCELLEGRSQDHTDISTEIWVFSFDCQSAYRIGTIRGRCSFARFHSSLPLLAIIQLPSCLHIFHVEEKTCSEIVHFNNLRENILGVLWFCNSENSLDDRSMLCYTNKEISFIIPSTGSKKIFLPHSIEWVFYNDNKVISVCKSGYVQLWKPDDQTDQNAIEPPDNWNVLITCATLFKSLLILGCSRALLLLCDINKREMKILHLPDCGLTAGCKQLLVTRSFQDKFELLLIIGVNGALNVFSFPAIEFVNSLQPSSLYVQAGSVNSKFLALTYNNFCTKLYPINSILPVEFVEKLNAKGNESFTTKSDKLDNRLKRAYDPTKYKNCYSLSTSHGKEDKNIHKLSSRTPDDNCMRAQTDFFNTGAFLMQKETVAGDNHSRHEVINQHQQNTLRHCSIKKIKNRTDGKDFRPPLGQDNLTKTVCNKEKTVRRFLEKANSDDHDAIAEGTFNKVIQDEGKSKQNLKRSASKKVESLATKEGCQALIAEFGRLPSKQRGALWCCLLQLPRSKLIYRALLAKGIHPSVLLYDNMADTALRDCFRSALSCLFHWAPELAKAAWVPSFVFPFVKSFKDLPLLSFEVCVTLLCSWCRLWLTRSPLHSPAVKAVEKMIAERSPRLAAQLLTAGVHADVYAWSLLSSAISKVLSPDDWLTAWDHVVSESPSFLLCLVAAYTLCLSSTIAATESEAHIKALYNQESFLPVRTILRRAHDLYKTISLERELLDIIDKVSVYPKDGLPVFDAITVCEQYEPQDINLHELNNVLDDEYVERSISELEEKVRHSTARSFSIRRQHVLKLQHY